MISIEPIDSERSLPEKPYQPLKGAGERLIGLGEMRNLEMLMQGHHQARLEDSRHPHLMKESNRRSNKRAEKQSWLQRAWCFLSTAIRQPNLDR